MSMLHTTEMNNQTKIKICNHDIKPIAWYYPKPKPFSAPLVSNTPYRKPNLRELVMTIAAPLVMRA